MRRDKGSGPAPPGGILVPLAVELNLTYRDFHEQFCFLNPCAQASTTTIIDKHPPGRGKAECGVIKGQAQRQGKLTARAHFAVLIDLDKGSTPQRAVADLLKPRPWPNASLTGVPRTS